MHPATAVLINGNAMRMSPRPASYARPLTFVVPTSSLPPQSYRLRQTTGSPGRPAHVPGCHPSTPDQHSFSSEPSDFSDEPGYIELL